jgi:hypothetical protein
VIGCDQRWSHERVSDSNLFAAQVGNFDKQRWGIPASGVTAADRPCTGTECSAGQTATSGLEGYCGSACGGLAGLG